MIYNKSNNLKTLRKYSFLSQQDIADILGLSRASYVSKENGKNDFTQTEIQKLMELFNLPYESIFFVKVAHEVCAS